MLSLLDINKVRTKAIWGRGGEKMVQVYVARGFSKANTGGNRAGVVLDGIVRSTAQKIHIAKVLGYSETAFVLDSVVADFKLEYFTPTEEVPLCGHATIATFSLLKALGRLDRSCYSIETKAGILKVNVADDGRVLMQQNAPVYDAVLERTQLAQCIEETMIRNDLPIQIVSTGLKDILIPVVSEEALGKWQPDLQKIANLCQEEGVVGVHAFAFTKDNEVTAVCRNFAPLYGIDEESATGTSNCALACYLYKYDQKQEEYIFEQGHHLGEVSRLVVQIEAREGEIEAVYVGGYGSLEGEKWVSEQGE